MDRNDLSPVILPELNFNQPGPQSPLYPGLESWDFKAKMAIKGMGPSKIANQLELYELHYDGWLGRPGFWARLRKPFRRLAMHIARTPLRIFRQEVEELALAHAKALTDLKAAAVRDSFHDQYCKMVDENRGLRSFLMNNFPAYVETADALKLPMIEISKRIMMDLRRADGTTPTPHVPGVYAAITALDTATDDARRLNDAIEREEGDAGH